MRRDYIRSTHFPKTSSPESYQKCLPSNQHTGRLNRWQRRVSPLQDQWCLSFMQCTVNNKKFHFGDEFPSCSDVAMTEQYYMQIQVFYVWLRHCNNYSLTWTDVVLDFSYVTGYREQTSWRREILSEARKQPVFFLIKIFTKKLYRHSWTNNEDFSYVFVAEQATFCATFGNPGLWDTQQVCPMWFFVCLRQSKRNIKLSVTQN